MDVPRHEMVCDGRWHRCRYCGAKCESVYRNDVYFAPCAAHPKHPANLARAQLDAVDKVLREFEGMTGAGYRYMAANIRTAIAKATED